VHDQCSALLLPESRTELIQLLSKRQRANLRCAGSRLGRSGGGQVELATPETLPQFLDDLFRLHTRRWWQAGESGVLADERLRRFHEEAATKLLEKAVLRLYRLRLTGRTIAVLYSLLRGTTLFCYLQGYDPEFAQLSPGTQLTFFAMEDALELGIRKFDFLRGQEAYKRHWRVTPEATYRIQLTRDALNARLSAQETAA
jgi:CelD/BcsL family acetyltransferase involved in cellulose biosynthesis